ncbi:Hypothetical predicted protein [Paramuricea clavata]|uniref:Uncharacterized protein n=1 Tax=Paramuricea clavata TaxID=317549 RepID=A0A6S7GIG5_PARCT|nr:Hypothetical predicted protein [Paramuricea clavata]
MNLKKARKSNSNEDWATYRRTRNIITNRIRSAKEKYHRNFIYDNSHNPRSFWKTMKKEVKEQFILNNLRKIDVKKAAGLDNTPPRLLKDSANVIARQLTKIINVSLEQGTMPDDFKLAKVIPVFKKGQPGYMDNYRPISVLPTVSKLLEKAVHDHEQLYRFLTTNHLLNPYQCGFRKYHSTETAVISLTDSIRRNIDQKMLTGAIFVDLRKAFDTVDAPYFWPSWRVTA